MILEAKQKLLVLIFLGCIWACQSQSTTFQRLTGNAQGTTFSIIYKSAGNETYEAEVDSLLKSIDHSMSLWDDSSLISRFNAGKDSIEVDSAFREVFRRSLYFYELSDGAFDPTVGPLMKAWGFIQKKNLPLPGETQTDSLKQLIGLTKCHLSGTYIVKTHPGVQLDFNAIAQGYTADIIGRFLQSKGVKDYLIEIGGEVLAKGLNEQGKKWRVGIESPEFNSGEGMNSLQGIIELSDGALATSGNYRNYYVKDDKVYSHTIDPKTAKPVNHSLLSVSVIASSAMDADAFATICMVMGKEKALEIAAELGMSIQCISSVNGELSVAYSPGFEEMMVLED